MRFYRIDDVPMSESDIVFRDSWTHGLIGLVSGVVLLGAYGTLAWFAWSWWLVLPLVFVYWLARMVFRLFVLSLGRDNWVVRMRPGSLVVRLRSYLNSAHLPLGDVVTVELDRNEIAGFAPQRLRLVAGDDDGEMDIRKRYLQIVLRPGDDTELARLGDLIAAERACQGEAKGLLNSRTKYLHYPASVSRRNEQSILRVEWLATGTAITPRLSRALQTLSRLAPILEEDSDFVDARPKSPAHADAESRLIALVEAGEIMAAIKTARGLYGMSLTEAKTFVEGLGSGNLSSSTGGKP